MRLTVAELLALPILEQARPEVISGADLHERQVRWVHTSEIYEIGPLLKGGEVLLTTGLGLVGAGPAQLRAYVDALADQGVAALILELGRSFPVAPEALCARARERGLPLVVLHGVVPFVEVTETVHHRLVAHEVVGLRRLERANAALTATLLSGGGLRALVQCVHQLTEQPCALVASDGRTAAEAGPTAQHPVAWRQPVDVFGVEWGHLALHGADEVDDDTRAVLARAANAIGVELVRSGAHAPARLSAGRALVQDLAYDRVRSAAEATTRAEAVGLGPRPGHGLVAVCCEFGRGTDLRAAVNATAEAGRQLFGAALVADVDGAVLLAGRTTARDEPALRALTERLVGVLDTELSATGAGRLAAAAAALPVPEPIGLVRAVAAAREAAALARRTGHGHRAVLTTDVAVHRLLSRLIDDPELERFVDEQLGGLLEHDARRGTRLVPTLEAYLGSGLSKTRTAQALGIRRQSLYARLDRIGELLGRTVLDESGRRTALQLALIAWRLRATAVRLGQPTASITSSLTS